MFGNLFLSELFASSMESLGDTVGATMQCWPNALIPYFCAQLVLVIGAWHSMRDGQLFHGCCHGFSPLFWSWLQAFGPTEVLWKLVLVRAMARKKKNKLYIYIYKILIQNCIILYDRNISYNLFENEFS